MEETSSICSQKYNVRYGTIDFGRDYEYKIAALLSLKCLNNKDMWLATNVDQFSEFDDIVLYQEKDGGKKMISLIQVKFQTKQSNIDIRDFRIEKGNFSLKKYCEGIFNIIRECENSCSTSAYHFIKDNLSSNYENLEFIIFTNRGVVDIDYFKSESTKSMFSLHNSMYTQGYISQFDYEKFDLKFTNNNPNDLLGNFFLFSEQIHLKNLDVAIENEIANIIKPMNSSKRKLKELSRKFITFIIDWSSGKLGGHFILTKNHILDTLLELTIAPYMITLKKNYIPNKFSFGIWRRVIKEKNIIFIEKDSLVLQYLTCYVCKDTKRFQKFSESCNNKIWNSSKNRTVIIEISNERLEDFLKFIQQFQVNFKLIILIENVEELRINCNSLTCFQDIGEETQKKILNYFVKLQGRSSIKLSDVIDDRKIYKHIKIKDLIYILCKKFNIGNQLESLPNDYIKRSLTQVWLDPTVLQCTTNDIFVIKCNRFKYKVFEEKLNIKDAELRIILCDEFYENDIQTNSEYPVHYLILHDENDLEWIKSYGTIKNIARYKKIRGCQKVKRFCKSSKTKLISACPGMGKTILMNYVAVSTSRQYWVVRINFIEHTEIFKTAFDFNIKNFLLNISNTILNSSLSRALFKNYLSKKQIVVILDGFDEISVNYQTEAERIIKELKDNDYDIFLTTRSVLKTKLEQLLDVFAVTINPLNKKEQNLYFAKYFNSQNIIDKLLSSVGDDFASIPLQAKLLADTCINNYANLDHFDLLGLYKNVIDCKMKIACNKFGTYIEDLMHSFKSFRSVYALKTLFRENDLEKLNINFQQNDIMKHFSNMLALMQKDGITVIENELNVRFVHRTFAEYVTAEWLYENIHTNIETVKILIKKMFELKFTILRNIFDSLLSRGSILHLFVINKQFEKAKNLIRANPELVMQVDEAKRSILHLISAWDLNIDILKLFPSGSIKNEVDIFGYSPLDYALMNGSYNIVNVIYAELNLCIGNIKALNTDMNKYSLLFVTMFKRNKIINTKDKNDRRAVTKENINIFQMLMANRSDPNLTDNNIIDISCLSLQKKFNINFFYHDNTSLHHILRCNKKRILELLLNVNATITFTGKKSSLFCNTDIGDLTILRWASAAELKDIVNILTKCEVSPDIKSSKGKMPIYRTAEKSYMVIIGLLLCYSITNY